MNGVTVRELIPDDWADFRAARLGALEAEPDCFGVSASAERLRDEATWAASLSTVRWFGAIDEGGGLSGLAALYLDDRSPDGAPQLGSMWVAPRRRRLGVASGLEGIVAATATAAGARRLGLWVTAGNDRAAHVYAHLGYRRTGVTKVAPKDSLTPMHRWVRDLAPRPIRR